MDKKLVVFWFRRDLRLEDNAALYHALQEEQEVLPIFIFDTSILSQLDKKDARVTFIHDLLEGIQFELQKLGKSLAVFYGNPKAIWEDLLTKHNVTTVYTNHDYEPYARKRDKEINSLLQQHGVAFKTCKDQVIFEKKEVVKDDGSPYVVYTPYSKKWKEKFRNYTVTPYPSEEFLHKIKTHDYPFLSIEDIQMERSTIAVPKYHLNDHFINEYANTRNIPSLTKGTSLLAPHLRFGSVSIRKIVAEAQKSSQETFWNELIWREFFMQILWHFPHTVQQSFREKYDLIVWENDVVKFQKWCEGKTGYPFVDAGMRELNATGHMHNRVRMIVASFLCKHLLIDWRWGEAYFANKLLDYEQASNVGNWQWAAGSGVDAAPYFRIFNPTEQVKKFDPKLTYIKKWVPELETPSYPKPIVDHKIAREKCLQVYKAALE